MTDISKYHVEQAEKLLKNIEMLGDIAEIKVPKPDSSGLEMISLKVWIQWLWKRVERLGSFGIEQEFISIIKSIYVNNQLMTDRTKDGFRKLLDAIELYEKENIELKEKLEAKEKELRELNEKLIDKIPNAIKNEVVSVQEVIQEPTKPLTHAQKTAISLLAQK